VRKRERQRDPEGEVMLISSWVFSVPHWQEISKNRGGDIS
jgi:hypothetical protein